ncbi:Fe2+-dependent dioxygenase [Ottowia pentelensis]|uniref:Fe2+-dependent dioxygenase n=1 Tax=Ottowia pentelensis TaxID=511108 RepID=UPI00362576AF
MLTHLKQLLTPEELAQARALLRAPGALGRRPPQRRRAGPAGQEQPAAGAGLPSAGTLRALVLAALQRDALFLSAALPRKIFNPLFNRYEGAANHYGAHVDNAVLHAREPDQWVRADLSCTLFLTPPEDYEGGELRVHERFGHQDVKLPAGDAVLYPATSVHEVRPVTRGARLASFFWVESMVRSDEQRRLLFDMDMALLQLRQRHGDSPEATRLTGTYHNLLRLWAST